MSAHLPLEILSLISPILSWVEGTQPDGLPCWWGPDAFDGRQRELGWLKRELPTHSLDNFNDLLRHHDISPAERALRQYKKRRETSARFMDPPSGFSIVNALRILANRYLFWDWNELTICAGRMVEFHELAFRFPVMHLMNYAYVSAYVHGSIRRETALTQNIHLSQLHTAFQSFRNVTLRGLSEGHLHLNNLISPDQAWADSLMQPDNDFLAGNREEDRRLFFLARSTMSLATMALVGGSCHLPDFISSEVSAQLDALYRAPAGVARHFQEKRLQAQILEYKNHLFAHLGHDKIGLDNPLPGELLTLIHPTFFRSCPIRHAMIQSPSQRFRRGSLHHHLEMVRLFVFEVLVFLLRCESRPHQRNHKGVFSEAVYNLVSCLFFRYLVYHTHNWQCATVGGRTTGLRAFRNYAATGQRKSFRHKYEAQGLAFEALSEDRTIRHIEGRVSPPREDLPEYKTWLLAYARQHLKHKVEKFGFIVHFKKANEDESRVFPSADFGNFHTLRYGRVRRQTRIDAEHLFHLLATPHPVVPFIVGIDAANLELTTPPEVFAPTFQFLRHRPIDYLRTRSIRRRFGEHRDFYRLAKKRRLGMTFHVGEDFRHLLSGLRAIDEVITFLQPKPGDRLGHALALGLCPENWAGQVGFQARLSHQEWLDTLVWLHHVLGPGHELVGSLQLEDRIQRLSRHIYGGARLSHHLKGGSGDHHFDWPIPTLHDAWLLRQLDPYLIRSDKLIDGEIAFREPRSHSLMHTRWRDAQQGVKKQVDQNIGWVGAFELLGLYWYDPRCRERGNELLTINMDGRGNYWVAACREAQQRMCAKVNQAQLVVELNPSSNRQIGQMSRYSEHPVFDFTLDETFQLTHQLRATINTDNPGLLATTLAHEYYLLAESLLAKGAGEGQVSQWLEHLRRNGEDYSFLRDLPDSKDPLLLRFLEDLVQKNDHRVQAIQGRFSMKSLFKRN